MHTNSFQIFGRRRDLHLNQFVPHLRLDVGRGGGGGGGGGRGVIIMDWKYLYIELQGFP